MTHLMERLCTMFSVCTYMCNYNDMYLLDYDTSNGEAMYNVTRKWRNGMYYTCICISVV